MGDTAAPVRLVGVGVGPGDPELITVKAIHALEASDVILVPATEASGDAAGRAETIVTRACPQVAEKIVRVPFSMADRSGVTRRRTSAWQTAAEAAVAAFERGAHQIGFATIGDPSVYSTFSYLAAGVRERVANLDVDVVPGITAMQALAAASRTPLVEGDEVLALVPLKHGTETLARVLDTVDTAVVYKSGRHLDKLRDLVAADGRRAVAGIDVGLPGERLAMLADLDQAPYFTSVLICAHRTSTGERL